MKTVLPILGNMRNYSDKKTIVILAVIIVKLGTWEASIFDSIMNQMTV